MAITKPTTYLITGANRGLGAALVAAYLARPNNIVVAAVRDPNQSASKALQDLPKGDGSSLIVVKIESISETDADEAVKQLQEKHGINSLDVVIANAAISKLYPLVQDARTDDLLEHYHVNVVGTIILFRAVLPLLKKSTNSPKFITIGSVAGLITPLGEGFTVPNSVYGTSKAAVHFITKEIHAENPELIAFSVHPGFVQTDMGNSAARKFGLEEAFQTIEESVAGLLKIFDESTRDKTSGKFWHYDGTPSAW